MSKTDTKIERALCETAADFEFMVELEPNPRALEPKTDRKQRYEAQ
jgi:hypothetical protein